MVGLVKYCDGRCPSGGPLSDVSPLDEPFSASLSTMFDSERLLKLNSLILKGFIFA
jgi:hypothetical protein